MVKIVMTIIIINLIFEIVELIFPAKKMKNSVKSFVLVLGLYVVCKYLFSLL